MKKITPLLLVGVLLASCSSTPKVKFNLTFDATKGEVTSSLKNGEYEVGTNIALSASANSGFVFSGFYNKETLLAKSAKYSFLIQTDLDIEAKFVKDGEDDSTPDKGDEEGNKPIDPSKVTLKGKIKPGENGVEKTKYDVVPIEEYYKTFDFSLTGAALRKEIANKTAPTNVIEYGTQTSHRLRFVDESMENLGSISGIYGDATFPNVWDSGNTWNKEHVWARSRMKKSAKYKIAEGDLHNLRACTPSVNGSRGNDCFDNSTHSHYFYPNVKDGDYRGDVARILFYMYSQYEELEILESPANKSNNAIGKLSVLLKRNKEDPVSEFEVQRNMKISMYQSNRNIFIDYPNMADSLFK